MRISEETQKVSKKVKNIFVAYREILKIHGNAEKSILSNFDG